MTTQLKYQLLRVSEILLNWAKFNKSVYLEEITETRTDLLVDQFTFEELSVIKANFWDIIIETGDNRLYNDLKSFYPDETNSTDPTSLPSMS